MSSNNINPTSPPRQSPQTVESEQLNSSEINGRIQHLAESSETIQTRSTDQNSRQPISNRVRRSASFAPLQALSIPPHFLLSAETLGESLVHLHRPSTDRVSNFMLGYESIENRGILSFIEDREAFFYNIIHDSRFAAALFPTTQSNLYHYPVVTHQTRRDFEVNPLLRASHRVVTDLVFELYGFRREGDRVSVHQSLQDEPPIWLTREGVNERKLLLQIVESIYLLGNRKLARKLCRTIISLLNHHGLRIPSAQFLALADRIAHRSARRALQQNIIPAPQAPADAAQNIIPAPQAPADAEQNTIPPPQAPADAAQNIIPPPQAPADAEQNTIPPPQAPADAAQNIIPPPQAPADAEAEIEGAGETSLQRLNFDSGPLIELAQLGLPEETAQNIYMTLQELQQRCRRFDLLQATLSALFNHADADSEEVLTQIARVQEAINGLGIEIRMLLNMSLRSFDGLFQQIESSDGKLNWYRFLVRFRNMRRMICSLMKELDPNIPSQQIAERAFPNFVLAQIYQIRQERLLGEQQSAHVERTNLIMMHFRRVLTFKVELDTLNHMISDPSFGMGVPDIRATAARLLENIEAEIASIEQRLLALPAEERRPLKKALNRMRFFRNQVILILSPDFNPDTFIPKEESDDDDDSPAGAASQVTEPSIPEEQVEQPAQTQHNPRSLEGIQASLALFARQADLQQEALNYVRTRYLGLRAEEGIAAEHTQARKWKELIEDKNHVYQDTTELVAKLEQLRNHMLDNFDIVIVNERITNPHSSAVPAYRELVSLIRRLRTLLEDAGTASFPNLSPSQICAYLETYSNSTTAYAEKIAEIQNRIVPLQQLQSLVTPSARQKEKIHDESLKISIEKEDVLVDIQRSLQRLKKIALEASFYPELSSRAKSIINKLEVLNNKLQMVLLESSLYVRFRNRQPTSIAEVEIITAALIEQEAQDEARVDSFLAEYHAARSDFSSPEEIQLENWQRVVRKKKALYRTLHAQYRALERLQEHIEMYFNLSVNESGQVGQSDSPLSFAYQELVVLQDNLKRSISRIHPHRLTEYSTGELRDIQQKNTQKMNQFFRHMHELSERFAQIVMAQTAPDLSLAEQNDLQARMEQLYFDRSRLVANIDVARRRLKIITKSLATYPEFYQSFVDLLQGYRSTLQQLNQLIPKLSRASINTESKENLKFEGFMTSENRGQKIVFPQRVRAPHYQAQDPAFATGEALRMKGSALLLDSRLAKGKKSSQEKAQQSLRFSTEVKSKVIEAYKLVTGEETESGSLEDLQEILEAISLAESSEVLRQESQEALQGAVGGAQALDEAAQREAALAEVEAFIAAEQREREAMEETGSLVPRADNIGKLEDFDEYEEKDGDSDS